MADKPLLRQVYDKLERTVAPQLEQFINSDQYPQVVALVARTRSSIRGQLDGITAKMWHLANLPAGTDVQRLRAQVGSLDREVRRLTIQLSRQQSAERDGPRETSGE